MRWIKDLIGRLYGSTALENALLRGRLRALEERIREQNVLLEIQIRLIAHVVPKEKLPPWLQINLLHEEAVAKEDDEVVEELLDKLEEDEKEEDEDEDDQDAPEPPTIPEFVELITEDVEEILDIIETDLKPAMDGVEVLLSDVHPMLGERAHEWIIRMDALCERLGELREAFEGLAEEAAQVEQESKRDDEDDLVLGLG